MTDKEIMIKGTTEKLKIYPGDSVSLPELKAFLRQRFGEGGFFQGIDYRLYLLDRDWGEDDKEQIRNTIKEINPALKLVYFREDEDSTVDTVPVMKGQPMIIRRNFRSGQRIIAPGDLVIVGDVNPGAEVIAAGNIYVFGRVAGGVLHAGADGSNNKAQVLALSLQPTQLRIGRVITRAPDQKNSSEEGPELAKVQDNSIVVEKFTAR